MKKLLAICLVAFGIVVTSYATDDTVAIPTATVTSILAGQFHLQSLELVNNHPTATVTVRFYDAPSTSLVWTNAAYTNFTTYTTNIVITTTNYNGVVETSTNLATYTAPHAVALNASQAYKQLKSMSVAAGGTVTWTPVSGVYLNYGLAATNNQTNVTINYTYSSVR